MTAKKFVPCMIASVFVMAGHLLFAGSAELGLVLMHGKWGSPQGMMPLQRELESRGYLVSNQEMPWSDRRLYDVDYTAALKEIEQQVNQLHSHGATRVIVSGQSMGSNAAVAYAASGYQIDGLVIISPGHFPEGGMAKRVRPSLARAQSIVAANRGSEAEAFDDINQGQQRSIKMPAATYVSYFDPNGLGALTTNIRKLPKPIPVFMAIGKSDPFFPESKAMFASAPAHPLSRYVVLDAGHFDLLKVVASELLNWLTSVEGESATWRVAPPEQRQ